MPVKTTLSVASKIKKEMYEPKVGLKRCLIERIEHPSGFVEEISPLLGWKPPKWAYILFEAKEIHLRTIEKDKEGNVVFEESEDKQKKVPASLGPRVGVGLFCFNVMNRPDIGQKITQYMRKGFKIIDWGNFPKEGSKLARLHSGPSGKNPWGMLDIELKQITANSDTLAASLREENQAFLDKISTLEAENKRLKAEREAKDGDKNLNARTSSK